MAHRRAASAWLPNLHETNTSDPPPVDSSDIPVGRNPKLVVLFFLGLAFLLGGWIRFSHLGARPLAVDEYYFLQSITSILESGLPLKPGGGIYLRGVLLQYWTAGTILVLGKPLLALRLIPAILGFASCGLLFLYARRHLSLTVALALTVMVLFSSWEVEFSRFGRMYAGLQFVTIAFLLLMGDAIATGRRRSVYGAITMAFIGLGVHRLAVFYIPLLLPITLGIRYGEPLGIRLYPYRLAASALVGITALTLFRFPTEAGLSDPFPPDYGVRRESIIRVPEILGLGSGLWIVIALLGVLVLMAVLNWVSHKADNTEARPPLALHLWLTLLATSALLHLFLLAGIALLVLLARYRILSSPVVGRAREATALAVAVMGAWTALVVALLVVGSVGPFELPTEAGSVAGALRRIFFAWPDVYEPIIVVWSRAFPLLTIMLGLAIGWRTIRSIRWSIPRLLLEPAVIIAYFTLVLGLFEPLYQQVRYTYFLYPVALVVLGQAVTDLWVCVLRMKGRGAVPALATATLMLLFVSSRDFHPSHLADLAGQDQTFRIGRWEGYGGIWYNRRDYESPARYLSVAAGPQEPVVLVNQPVVSYYLSQPHLQFIDRDRDWAVYTLVSRELGTVYAWSGGPLLGSLSELEQRVGDAPAIWVVDSVPWSQAVQEFVQSRNRSATTVFRSVDGRLQVLRVDVSASQGSRAAPVGA